MKALIIESIPLLWALALSRRCDESDIGGYRGVSCSGVQGGSEAIDKLWCLEGTRAWLSALSSTNSCATTPDKFGEQELCTSCVFESDSEVRLGSVCLRPDWERRQYMNHNVVISWL